MPDIPKRRGRPPKVKIDGERGPPSHAGYELDKVTRNLTGKPIAERGSARFGRAGRSAADSAGLFFSLSSKDGRVRLRLTDGKGRAVGPDYRRYSGAVRDALRECAAELRKGEEAFRWSGVPADDDGATILDPPPRLIDLAAEAGLLADGHCARSAPRGACTAWP